MFGRPSTIKIRKKSTAATFQAATVRHVTHGVSISGCVVNNIEGKIQASYILQDALADDRQLLTK